MTIVTCGDCPIGNQQQEGHIYCPIKKGWRSPYDHCGCVYDVFRIAARYVER